MKLDRYDIALTKGVAPEDSRPMLGNIHLKDGRLSVADGFLIITREADITEEEKGIETLIPAKIFREVKVSPHQITHLAITPDTLTVTHQKAEKPIPFNPTLSFQPYDAGTGKYPSLNLYITSQHTEKQAQIAVNVGLLKRILSCMPNDGILRLGITGEAVPLEFECGRMDRPIRGLLMPMFVDWESFKWHREPVKEEVSNG